MPAADQSAGMRLARWSAALIIVGVGAAAFRLSFSTLEDLATLARIPAGDAWLFPLIVDGTILLATARSCWRRSGCWCVLITSPNAASLSEYWLSAPWSRWPGIRCMRSLQVNPYRDGQRPW